MSAAFLQVSPPDTSSRNPGDHLHTAISHLRWLFSTRPTYLAGLLRSCVRETLFLPPACARRVAGGKEPRDDCCSPSHTPAHHSLPWPASTTSECLYPVLAGTLSAGTLMLRSSYTGVTLQQEQFSIFSHLCRCGLVCQRQRRFPLLDQQLPFSALFTNEFEAY